MSSYLDFVKTKKSLASVKERKSLIVRDNGRSADFIAPTLATGCELSCAYCAISRHRPYGNPLEQYTNLDQIWNAVYVHWLKLPPKEPNQCDPVQWTYDIGESTDCLSPANITATNWLIEKFVTESKAKPTFATKLANHRDLIEVPQGAARVRLSLMPQVLSDVVENGTSKVSARIRAIDELIAKGYEVHLNFSPVVVVSGIQQHYIELFQEIDLTLSSVAKSQLKCEVIFLTHNQELHDKNMSWNPAAEDILWKPEWQELKTNHRGSSDVLRYHHAIKSKLVAWFKEMLSVHLPYCKIRYIF